MRKLLKITTTFALALVLSAGMAFGQNNEAEIQQTSSTVNSSATQSQNGDDFAYIFQNGVTEAEASQKQYAGPTGKNGSNEAHIYQTSSGTKPVATQIQGGKKQDAEITQKANKVRAYQRQLHKNNSATIVQTNGSLKSEAVQVQGPNGPNGKQGAFNDATIRQEGLESYAEQRQGGWRQDSKIKQFGDHNEAYVTQNGTAGMGRPQAHITQSSDNNMATINQAGVSNTATITQN